MRSNSSLSLRCATRITWTREALAAVVKDECCKNIEDRQCMAGSWCGIGDYIFRLLYEYPS